MELYPPVGASHPFSWAMEFLSDLVPPPLGLDSRTRCGYLQMIQSLGHDPDEIAFDRWEAKYQQLTIHALFPVGFAAQIRKGDVVKVWDFSSLGYVDETLTLQIDLWHRGRAAIQLREDTPERVMVELFGGMGAWTFALDLIPGQWTHFIVEKDQDVAKACAATHQLDLYHMHDLYQQLLYRGVLPSKGGVIVADVEDHRLWVLLSCLQPKRLFLSPPCQPWCTVGNQLGLEAKDGRIWARTFRGAGDLGLISLTCETVHGFRSHRHAKVLVTFAKMCGYSFCCGGPVDVHQTLPIVRTRWVGSFLLNGLADKLPCEYLLHIQHHKLPIIPDLDGLVGHDAWIEHFDEHELEEVQIPSHVCSMLSDLKYLPAWWNGERDPDPQAVWCKRVIKPDQALEGVMASYGCQHEIDEGLLRRKGLCTRFLPWDSACGPFKGRYFHHWEIVAALGWPFFTKLPLDLQLCRKITGNGLTTAQAVFGIFQLHRALRDLSPFHDMPSLQQLCDKIISATPKLSFMKRIVKNGFRGLEIPVGGLDGHDGEDEPSVKRRRIPGRNELTPTIPFTLQDSDQQSVPVPTTRVDVALDSDLQVGIPTQEQLLLWLCDFTAKKSFDDSSNGCIPMILSALERTWVYIGWVNGNVDFLSCIRFALPHAMSRHFNQLILNNTMMDFNAVPVHVTSMVVQMSLRPLLLQFRVGHSDKQSAIVVDVCTTVEEVVGKIAPSLGVSPTDLDCFDGTYEMTAVDFVAGMRHDHLTLTWKPRICYQRKGIKPVMYDMPQVIPPTHSDASSLACHQQVRFVARHPIWSTVRTVVRHTSVTLHELACGLFPDLGVGIDVVAAFEHDIMSGDMKFNQFGLEKGFDLELQAKRPFPIIRVDVMRCDSIPDSEMFKSQAKCLIKRWIKSPFHVRAREYQVDATMPVGCLAAAFFGRCNSSQTILTLCQNRLTDPRTLVKDCHVDSVLEFRCCCLPGGAKPATGDDPKKTLAELLQSKGVPGDKATERATMAITKIGIDSIKHALTLQQQPCWEQIKKLANTNKIRLITPEELKVFQRQARQDSVNKKVTGETTGAPSKPKKVAQDVTPTLDLGDLTIHLDHFEAAGNAVERLPLVDFGRDKTGICVVSKENALKYLPLKQISVDPLALLVVGYPAVEGYELLSIPATKSNGTPVILPATLVNFGEVKVQHVSKTKAVILQETKSCVVDFQIVRLYCKDWPSTQATLQFLGTHLPDLRNGVIASWAIRPYDSARKPASHPKAESIHGFLRVKEECLDKTLARSGSCGIFLTPKTESKLLDPRYGTVILTSKTLDEALVQVALFKNALGLVMVRKQFALRCKKEHLHDARMLLAPESIFIPMGQPELREDSKLWILSRMNMSTTHEVLTKGLRDIGWDACALRQIGAQSWLISASAPPPAPHLTINGSMVLVMPKQQKFDVMSHPVSHMALKLSGEPTDEVASVTTAASSTTRFEELRKELEVQFHESMDQRFKEVDNKISATEQKIEKLHNGCQEEFQALRAEQTTLATSVQATSTNILSQMNSMFQAFQAETEKSFKALHKQLESGTVEGEADAKRLRTD